MSKQNQFNGFDKIEVIRKLQGVTSTQKLILLIIASHLGDNDFAFLSLSTLQKECCIATRHNVTDNIKVLIEKKILIKLIPSDGYKSNRYGIDFSVLASAVKELVPERNRTSAVKELAECRKGTSLVPQRNPKEIQTNIKKIKESASRDLSVDKSRSKVRTNSNKPTHNSTGGNQVMTYYPTAEEIRLRIERNPRDEKASPLLEEFMQRKKKEREKIEEEESGLKVIDK